MKFHIFILLIAVLLSVGAEARLYSNYYARSCPNVESIVRDAVVNKQLSAQTTAAGTLRLFFHDCFVGGCDASVLVSSSRFLRAERDADINLSLPGDAFDAVVRAKTNLELACPATVSCADVLALATRDLLTMLGGPFYRVRLGRRDSLSSSVASVADNLPLPNMSVPQLIKHFQDKGFRVREMVALTGAHTVGFSHCKEFASRIYNYNNGGPTSFDPSMNPRLAQGLQSACRNHDKDPTISAFNDIMTPSKFDNMYFKNLERGLGLLASDQALMADPRTAALVREYAANETAFFNDFVLAMQKLSEYGVKTGSQGEVRRRCDVFNNFSL
ncbi:uncharacterized protein M6B38_264615 [Iris pallida]|uniref:Peroxidase n=1 Tax=Iris pallida TaxID=29817 RepID=A0AAX6IC35_IRIPA|nr:uncharacterized protein M6B38_264615 [Iris pallida]